MPLVRFSVKNEYGLGVEELYKDGVQSEDPKAVLDGVAVAGLVGVLRQLGDLAQFAAEVFHGLQEQVASTSSRSRKLVNRIQRIEASLPSIEKAILSQTDHLRFAYTPGSEWHSRIKDERNHFICDDLPHFIMDSYEECREPPRLQLLDRFDAGGPGSCLKRYSDPTFFKRASSRSEVSNNEKSQRERKARKIKKRRSWQRSGQLLNSAPQIVNGSCRMQFSSTGKGHSSLSHTGSTYEMTFKSDLGDQSDSRGSKDGKRHSSLSHTASTYEMTFKSDLGDQSDSRGSKDGLDFSDCVSHPSILTLPDETQKKELCSSVMEAEVNSNGSIHLDEQIAVASNDKSNSHAVKETIPRSSSATWDEKLEISEPTDVNYEIEGIQQVPVPSTSLHELEVRPVNEKGVNQVNNFSGHGSTPESKADGFYLKTTNDEYFMEPTRLSYGDNEVRDYLKTNFSLDEHYLKPAHRNSCIQEVGLSEGRNPPEKTTNGNLINNPAYRRWVTGEAQYLLEANYIVAANELDIINSERGSKVDAFTEGGNEMKAIEWSQQQPETANAERVNQVNGFHDGGNDVKALEWSHQDMEIVNPQHVSHGDAFSVGVNRVKVIEWNQLESETIKAEHVSLRDAFSEVGNSVNLNKGNQQELETQDVEKVSQVDMFTGVQNCVQIIEWNHFEDIDSGTENFVDALNTIESESESDFETEMKKELQATALKDDLGEDAVNGQTAHIASHLVPTHQHLSASYDQKEGDLEDTERSTASVSSANMSSPDRTQSSHDMSESAAELKLDVSTCLSDEQAIETSQSVSLSTVSQVLDFCANDPEIRVEPAVSEIAKSGSEAPGDDRIICAPHVPRESSIGSSTTYPHSLWTNGTLLGLQPSKPTVFGSPNSGDSAHTSNSNEGHCSLDAVQKLNTAAILSSSANEIEHGNEVDNFSRDVGSSEHLFHQRLEKAHDTSVGHDKSNVSDHPVIVGLSNGDDMPLESKVPTGTNVKNVSSEATGASEDRSSLLFLLSRGLLKNGLRRSGSLSYEERHESSKPLKSNYFDNIFQDAVSHSVPETDLKENLNSPVNSPPTSPPLEHMKISFQPVDRFDTSRLKLKYPEGVDHYENCLDAFPSFQLVPEVTKLQHDIGSDSDDDTFCRSYACMSDESLSQSDSNSEQWESGDSAESNDPTLYNGLRRISSAEFTSVSPQQTEADHGNIHAGSGSANDAHSLSNPVSGLPILNANPFSYQQMKLCLNPGVDSSHLQDPTHEPPPLPPLQWRVSRPPFDEVEDHQDQGSDAQSQSFVPKLSSSAIAHPIQMDSSNRVNTPKESTAIAKPKKGGEDKFRHEKTYPDKDRGIDDKGDFLHQIRTKSFNLKRTEPTRSTYTPTPTTSNKITAILQKANAIRQVVGSDDGEDDSWSDT